MGHYNVQSLLPKLDLVKCKLSKYDCIALTETWLNIIQSREFHNHKPQPFPDTKRKRKQTNSNKHKSNKRTKSSTISSKISSLFSKRGKRNAQRTEKQEQKITPVLPIMIVAYKGSNRLIATTLRTIVTVEFEFTSISHEYSSLFIIVINLIFMFSH